MKKEEIDKKAHTSAGKDLLEGEKKLIEKYTDTTDVINAMIAIAFNYIDKPIASIENKLLSSVVDKKIDKPIFVMGHFRTGTTFLEKVIAGHNKVGFIPLISHATPLSVFSLDKLIRLGLKLGFTKDTAKPGPHTGGMPMSLFDPAEVESIWAYCKKNPFGAKTDFDLLDRDFNDPIFEKHFKSVINKCLFIQKKSRFVHKNPMNGYRIGYLSKIFPDAKFIRTIRHPYLVVQSQVDILSSLSIIIDSNKIFKKLLRLCISLAHVPSTKPGYSFRTPQINEIMSAFKQDKTLGIAMLHVEYEQIVDRMIQSNNLENQFYQLRYEDLINNFAQESKNIFEFIELYDDYAVDLIDVQKNKLLKTGKPPELPLLSEKVRDILQPLIKKYGYSETELS